MIILVIIAIEVIKAVKGQQYKKLEKAVLKDLGFSGWNSVPYFDKYITVKSRQRLEKYDAIKFFKENKDMLEKAEKVIEQKKRMAITLKEFLESNEYETCSQYNKVKKQIHSVLKNSNAFRVKVSYISSAGNNLGSKTITVNQHTIDMFKDDPSLVMGKGEYNKYLREQQKEALSQKQHEYYERVNSIIEISNESRDSLIIKDNQEQLDSLIIQLFDKTVNSIKKIKELDSEEWNLIGDFIDHINKDVEKIINMNQQILEYYESPDFLKIKETCKVLMNSQREFNEYINDKVQSISRLFGTRVVRNETINEDEYNYIRPYKKTITPFTVEVSATVFASAENMDAKQIIENYKAEYQQYLGGVPDFIMENDKAGFYSRLGFATVDESVLTVEYKFSYTSGGGMARRSFTVPMTEENISELIKVLESKLTASAFAKEQRILMTKKLRDLIKRRDNFTCCNCGNSTYAEPNLLLEIDHIIPVAKGGRTVEENLQTLCWKCNRAKGAKITD